MIGFKEFLVEGFHIDNPGGEWLRHKQEDAGSKKIGGAITAWHDNPVKLKTEHLKSLSGARGEEKHRSDYNSPKYKQFEQQVGHPSKFDSKKHPIMVGVNHKGEGHIIEGNHRLAYAVRHKIPHLHTELRYYNGGEAIKGHMHPDNLKEHAGFWGHWGLAKKYHDDTPGQDWKRISKLIKKYKAEK